MSRRPLTRDQLLEVKRSISSLKKGKEILERKRDTLLQLMEDDKKRFREIKGAFLRSCTKIYSSYALARLHDGEASISLLGISIPKVRLPKGSIRPWDVSIRPFTPMRTFRRPWSFTIPCFFPFI